MTEELAAQIERHGRQKRPKGNKHEIPMREARLRERNGSGERFHQQVQGQANSHTNHLGNKAMKDGGMIRDSFPGINSPGQAPVEHAPGFSGASVEHAPGFSGGVGLWAGVVRSSPGRRLTLACAKIRRNATHSWHSISALLLLFLLQSYSEADNQVVFTLRKLKTTAFLTTKLFRSVLR